MTTAPIIPKTRPRAFPATRWSVVLSASRNPGSEAGAALETLCQTYWPPLYAYVRRCGHGIHDAQDLTQSFFAHLLGSPFLALADKDKGRFRTYLLTALKRFMSTVWTRSKTQKRGGDQTLVSFDTDMAERLFVSEDRTSLPPDRLYERTCALSLLDAAFTRLQSEFSNAGKTDEFEAFKPWLVAERGGIPYAEIADNLKRDEATVRVMVHRFRKRYRAIFKELVSQTLSSPDDLDDEMRCLRNALT